MNKNTLETLKKYFGYASFREGQVYLLPAAGIDAAEDEELKREFGSGMKIAEIARKHDRTYGAIRARLKKQGLVE